MNPGQAWQAGAHAGCGLQEAVKTSSARVGNYTTDTVAVAASASFSRAAAASYQAAAVPFKPAVVPFKPAAVPFRPTAVPSQQAGAATSSSKPVPAAVPFKSAAAPFESAVVPPDPAAARAASEESPNCPAPSLPFKLAGVPSETARLPSVTSELPLTASGQSQATAELKAASPLVTRPTKVAAAQPSRSAQLGMPFTSKAGLPITSPPAKAGLPITSPGLPITSPGLPIASPTAVTQPAPKAAEATRLPATPPSSGVAVATGMLSSPLPLSPTSTGSAPLPDQPPPVLTATGTRNSAVAAVDTATALNHQANKQGLSSPAVHTQAPSETVRNGTAGVDATLAADVVTQAVSGRRYPRARNQIVDCVKLHAGAVVEPVGDVLGRSLEQPSALAASRVFPRARNPIVHAVEARARALVHAGGLSVKEEAAAAAAAGGKGGDASKPTSAAVPRLDPTGVCQYQNRRVVDDDILMLCSSGLRLHSALCLNAVM